MSKNNAQISPIEVNPEHRLKILSEQQLKKIHQATLVLLEETGVKFPSEKALKIFTDAGANVDFEKQIVRIPPGLLLDALAKSPRNYTLGSRGDPSLDLEIDGIASYLSTDGCGTTTIDFETGQRRASRKSDVEDTALIADYVSDISFYWPMVSAQDTSSSTIPLHEIEAAFNNTEKHVQSETIMGEKVASYAVEMAKVIAGDSKKLRERPPLSLLICTIDPLAQDKDGIESGLTFAKAGLPVGFMAMPTMGSTSPVTLAGTMVVGNAEVISALALIQLAHPGAPAFYSLLPQGMLNPHTGGYFRHAPLNTVLNTAAVQMGHYYDVPVLGATFGISVTLSGADLLVGAGLREESTLLYYPWILLDCAELEIDRVLTEGINVDSESLALEEISEVGPRGNYLARRRTVKDLRKLWDPGITHQWSPEENDFRNSQEAAVEKINWILENHRPKPLDKKVKKEMRRIIEAAEKELS